MVSIFRMTLPLNMSLTGQSLRGSEKGRKLHPSVALHVTHGDSHLATSPICTNGWKLRKDKRTESNRWVHPLYTSLVIEHTVN